MHIAKAILNFAQFRSSVQKRHGRITTLHRKDQRRSRLDAHDPLHIGEIFDRAAVNRGHDVTGFEASRGGGAIFPDAVDTRTLIRLAEEREQRRKITMARMKFAIGPAATMAAVDRAACQGS